MHRRLPKKASRRRGHAGAGRGEMRGFALGEWWARENDVTPAPAALASERIVPIHEDRRSRARSALSTM